MPVFQYLGVLRQQKFMQEASPKNCETEPENGPDSRTAWWSRKRDRGLRPELSRKGSFVNKSYTELSFVVAVRRRRGPVFGTRIWSSKWDRELLHGRAKNGYRRFNFWALGPYGFVRLRGRSSPALCRPTPDPEPALRSKPRNPRRRKAMGGGVGLASAAGARARAR